MEFDEETISADKAMEIVEADILDNFVKLLDCDDYRQLQVLRRRLNEVVAVSALPEDYEDAQCGVGCSEVEGGTTIYAADDETFDPLDLEVTAMETIEESMAATVRDNDGIISITLMKDEEEEDVAPVIAGVIETKEIENEDSTPVGAIVGATVAAVLLAILALLLMRRRRDGSEEKALMLEDESDEAYQKGYEDGYEYRFQQFRNQHHDSTHDGGAEVLLPRRSREGTDGPLIVGGGVGCLSHSEMEVKAREHGYKDPLCMAAYCRGFGDGYDAAGKELQNATHDVRKCRSAQCDTCRQMKSPSFVYLKDIEPPDDSMSLVDDNETLPPTPEKEATAFLL